MCKPYSSCKCETLEEGKEALLKIRTEGGKGVFTCSLSLSSPDMGVQELHPAVGQQDKGVQGVCTAKRHHERLCLAVRSGIHVLGGKDARCPRFLFCCQQILDMCFCSCQRSVSPFCPTSVTHYEPPWSVSGYGVKLQVDVRAISMTCSHGCCSHRLF